MGRIIKISTIALAQFISTVTFLFSADPTIFSLTEVPVFQPSSHTQCEILEMAYASHIIRNPEEWENKCQRREVYKVDIIFTKYPYNKKDWIIHYDTLLEKRIRAVCALDPSIDRYQVTWNLVLQTECETEDEAKNLFHGVVLWYKELPEESVIITKTQTSGKTNVPVKQKVIVQEVKASSNIEELMSGSYQFPDSTVYKILERNNEWENMLIVNDWTASMYQYGAQAVLWHQLNLKKERVSQFVFFNDGDRKKHKKLGATGGIYFASPRNIDEVLRVMKRVQRNGTGGEAAENDIEALLKATKRTKSYREVILIADGRSAVRDISLLKELKVPIRIIVCGLKPGQAIRHDYLQLASATKGSIHTIEDDIWNLSELKEGERVTIQGVDYQRARGRIVKTRPQNKTPLKASL